MLTPILMLATSMIISTTIILMIITTTTTATNITIMVIRTLPIQILKHKQQEIKRINSRFTVILMTIMITAMITMDMIIVTIIIIMIIRREKSVHMPRQPERKSFNKWDSKENYQILMIIVMQIVKTSMYN